MRVLDVAQRDGGLVVRVESIPEVAGCPACGVVARAHDPGRGHLWQRERDGNLVSTGDLIHHSDAGSQYTAIRLTEHLALEGIAPSVGTVGDAYDNALMETVNGLFKTECIRTTVFNYGAFQILADVEVATAGWVDWYNNRRFHGTLGMLTPIEFETLYYEALTREPEPRKVAAENLGRFRTPSTPMNPTQHVGREDGQPHTGTSISQRTSPDLM